MQYRANHQTKLKKNTLSLAVAFASCVLSSGLVMALPKGGTVVGGDASIEPSNNTLNINQNSSRAIIEYQDFSIAAGENVNFYQPGANSIALNRVIGENLSEIYGNINANGTVFLVNPNGLLFGAGSQIDVGGLVATTLDVSNENFMSGEFHFASDRSSSIVNNGSIKSAGNVALISSDIVNNGDINANSVQLQSARAALIQTQGSGIPILVEAEAVSGFIQNNGSVQAENIHIDAAVENAMLNNVVENNGLIRAVSASGEGGKIIISGGAGDVTNIGVISVHGDDANAGEIEIVSGRISQAGRLDAAVTGEGDGGKILLNAENKIALQNESEATVDADKNGDAGSIIAFSPDTTLFRHDAKLSARGGEQAGDGGFIEVSGIQLVEALGEVDLTSPMGQPGLWYIDPIDINIEVAGSDNTFSGGNWDPNGTTGTATIDRDSLETALQSGDVTINTNTGTGGTGNININAGIDLNGTPSNVVLSLIADNDINVASGVQFTDSAPGSNEQVDINFNAGNDINFAANSGADTSGGVIDISLVAGNDINLADSVSIDAFNGQIALNAGNNANITGLIADFNDSQANPAVSIIAGNKITDSGDTATYDIDLGSADAKYIRLQAANGIEGLETDGIRFLIKNTNSGIVEINEEDGVRIFELDVVGTAIINAGNLVTSNINIEPDAVATFNADNLTLNTPNAPVNIADGFTLNVSGTVNITADSINYDTDPSNTFNINATTLSVTGAFTNGNTTFNTTVDNFNLVNTGTNNIIVNEADALNLTGIDTNGGDVNFSTSAGNNLTVSGDIDLAGVANATLNSGNDLIINANIRDVGGANSTNLDLIASNDVTIGDGYIIDAGTGDIEVTATSGSATITGLVASGAGTLATIVAGDQIIDGGDSARDIDFGSTGTLVLSAANGILGLETVINVLDITNTTSGNVEINEQGFTVVQTLNVAGDATITSDSARIRILETAPTVNNLTLSTPTSGIELPDAGLTIPGNLSLTADWIHNISLANTITVNANRLTLDSPFSMGDLTVTSQINELDATNSGTNTLILNDADSFNIVNFQNTNMGGMTFGTAAGQDLTISSAVELDGQLGNIQFNSGNDLFVNANISDTVGGNDADAIITLTAANNFTIADGVTVDAGIGELNIVATSGDATITGIRANDAGSVVNVTAGDQILDGGDSNLDVDYEGLLTLIAQNGVLAIETDVSDLSITNGTSGNVEVVDDNDISLQTLNVVGDATISSTGGRIRVLESAPMVNNLTLNSLQRTQIPAAGLTIANNLTINSGSLVDLTGAGNVNITANQFDLNTAQAANDVVINASVNSLNLTNSGDNRIDFIDTDFFTLLGVQNTGNGTSSLQSVGANDITISSAIDLDGQSGTVEIISGNDLNINAAIQDATGARDSTANLVLTAGANLTIADNTVVDANTGSITVTATTGSARVTGLRSSGNSAAISITAANQILGNGNSLVDIQTDNASGMGVLTLNAQNGISDLQTDVDILNLTNATSSDVTLSNNKALELATFSVPNLATLNVNGDLTVTAANLTGNDIDLISTGDFIALDAGIVASNNLSITANDFNNQSATGALSIGANQLTLNSGASNGDRTITAPIASIDVTHSGTSRLAILDSDFYSLLNYQNTGTGILALGTTAGNNLTISQAVDLDSQTGTIEFVAGADLTLDNSIADTTGADDTTASVILRGANNTRITDGRFVRTPTGTISVIAGTGDATITGLQSGANANAVSVTAGGSILDSGDAATDIVAGDGVSTGEVILSAATGMNGLEISAAAYSITNTTSGDVSFTDNSDITITGLNVAEGATFDAAGNLSMLASPVAVDDLTLISVGTMTLPDSGVSATGELNLTAASIIDQAATGVLALGADQLTLNTAQTGGDLLINSTINTLLVNHSGANELSILDADQFNIMDIQNSGNGTLVLGSQANQNFVLGADLDLDALTGIIEIRGGGDLTVNANIADLTGAADSSANLILSARDNLLINGLQTVDVGAGTLHVVTTNGDATIAGLTSTADANAISVISGGSILDGGNQVADIRAGSGAGTGQVTLNAQTGINQINVAASSLDITNAVSGNVVVIADNDSTVQTLDAASNVEIQGAGNLTLANLPVNVADLNLNSAGTLTLPDATLTVGANDLTLIADHITNQSASGSISVSANQLNINTAQSGGDLTVNTSIANLDAVHNGSNTLTILDADFFTLANFQNTNTGTLRLGTSAGQDLTLASNVDLDGQQGSIEFQAGRDLIVNASIQDSVGANDSTANLILRGTNNVTIANGEQVVSGDGSLEIVATNGNATISGLQSNSNAIRITAGGQVLGYGSGDYLTSAGLDISAQTGIVNLSGSAGRYSIINSVSGDIAITDSGSMIVDALTSAGLAQLTAVSDIQFNFANYSANSLDLVAGNLINIGDLNLQVDQDLTIDAVNIQSNNASIGLIANNADITLSDAINNLSLATTVNQIDLDVQAPSTVVNATAGLSVGTLNSAGAIELTSNGDIQFMQNAVNTMGLLTLNTNGADIVVPEVGGLVSLSALNITAAEIRDSDGAVALSAPVATLNLTGSSQQVDLNVSFDQLALNYGGTHNINIVNDKSLAITAFAAPNTTSIGIDASGLLDFVGTAVTTTGRLNVTAESLQHNLVGSLFTADQLNLSLTNATNAAGFDTTVNELDASIVGHDLSIDNQGQLQIVDLNNDGNGASVTDGNLSLSNTSGNIVVNSDITGTDSTNNQIQTGRLSLIADAGDILIGSQGNTVNVNSTSSDSLAPNIEIRLNDNSQTSRQIIVADGSSVNAIGGDILIDTLAGLSSDPDSGDFERTIELLGTAKINAYNSLNDGITGTVFLNGEPVTDFSGVDAFAGRTISLLATNPPEEIITVPNDAIHDNTDLSLVQPVETASPGEDASTQFDLAFGKCVAAGDEDDQSCRIHSAVKKFLSRWLIGGEMPPKIERP